MATPVGVVGFRGYSGAELVRILRGHPCVEPVLLEHRDQEDKPRPLGHPGPRRAPLAPETIRTEGLAAVFPATPADFYMEFTPSPPET